MSKRTRRFAIIRAVSGCNFAWNVCTSDKVSHHGPLTGNSLPQTDHRMKHSIVLHTPASRPPSALKQVLKPGMTPGSRIETHSACNHASALHDLPPGPYQPELKGRCPGASADREPHDHRHIHSGIVGSDLP